MIIIQINIIIPCYSFYSCSAIMKKGILPHFKIIFDLNTQRKNAEWT